MNKTFSKRTQLTFNTLLNNNLMLIINDFILFNENFI